MGNRPDGSVADADVIGLREMFGCFGGVYGLVLGATIGSRYGTAGSLGGGFTGFVVGLFAGALYSELLNSLKGLDSADTRKEQLLSIAGAFLFCILTLVLGYALVRGYVWAVRWSRAAQLPQKTSAAPRYPGEPRASGVLRLRGRYQPRTARSCFSSSWRTSMESIGSPSPVEISARTSGLS